MKRIFWIVFGIGNHALFAVTVWRLVPFLAGTSEGLFAPLVHRVTHLPWLAVDGLLAAQFAISHSWLLLPSTRDRLERFVPSQLYGCLFCSSTCASLLFSIELWQRSSHNLWRLGGSSSTLLWGAFVLAWAALVYSLSLTGLGYQTGFTPWWAWVWGRPAPRRAFAPRGAYRCLRHPVYLSFLGLIWFTPLMSLDHALLTAVWSGYIFVGSCLKDRRLLFYLGDAYRRYQAVVPGYPLLPVGPLARVPLPREFPEHSPREGFKKAA